VLRRTPELDAFEVRQLRDYPVNHERAWAIFDALWEHARRMGAVPRDPLEKLPEKIRIAKAVNGLKTSGGDRQSI
jgi:hypothetical protein